MKKKKGLQWEVVPERKEAVNREVQMYESKMSNYKRSPAVYGEYNIPVQYFLQWLFCRIIIIMAAYNWLAYVALS